MSRRSAAPPAPYTFGGGTVGVAALEIANAKTGLGFGQAVFLGILQRPVCLAVWLCLGARSTADKILAIVFPISGFVAAGFELCVTNMYFIPISLLIRPTRPFSPPSGKSAAHTSALRGEFSAGEPPPGDSGECHRRGVVG